MELYESQLLTLHYDQCYVFYSVSEHHICDNYESMTKYRTDDDNNDMSDKLRVQGGCCQ